MRLTVQLFANLAETCGARQIELCDLPQPLTAALVLDAFVDRFPQVDGMRDSIMFAVNAEYVSADHPVSACDEVALIPPVSGGSDDHLFKITHDVLDPTALHNLVLSSEAGAVSLFMGVVRDNNLGRDVDYLEYDAYPAMATKVMRQIAGEIRERWDVLDIAMHHRIGRLEIGEASVAVAVASAHRGEGIEACHYGIDRLKAIVPIWKKEVWADGEEWIEGSLTAAAEVDASVD
ncbi:MAG: molybdopterin converting factor [Chloroflexi bacterium]|nr:molybdopterin converting factor [Chloroflexota bacterium]